MREGKAGGRDPKKDIFCDLEQFILSFPSPNSSPIMDIKRGSRDQINLFNKSQNHFRLKKKTNKTQMIYRLPNSFGPRTDSPLPSALGRRLGLWTLLPRAGFWSRPRGGSGGEQKRGRRFRFDCKKKRVRREGGWGLFTMMGEGRLMEERSISLSSMGFLVETIK